MSGKVDQGMVIFVVLESYTGEGEGTVILGKRQASLAAWSTVSWSERPI